MNTLLVNIIGSLIVFSAAYRWLLMPRLPGLNPATVLIPVLLLHSLRHLGLMFITTGVSLPQMPQAFAIPAAAGDLLSSMLAFAAACCIHRKSAWAILMTWLFSIVGIADFAMAIVLSRLYGAGDFLGGAYWIPSFWVPLLIVGHVIILNILLNVRKQGLGLVV